MRALDWPLIVMSVSKLVDISSDCTTTREPLTCTADVSPPNATFIICRRKIETPALPCTAMLPLPPPIITSLNSPHYSTPFDARRDQIRSRNSMHVCIHWKVSDRHFREDSARGRNYLAAFGYRIWWEAKIVTPISFDRKQCPRVSIKKISIRF